MKVARHEKTIELIRQYEIDTQEELAARLNEAAFKVTQATVSRDIRALKMTKVAGRNGKSRYAILEEHTPDLLSDKYVVFLEGFRLFAERDKFFDLCFAFPGKEVHNCFRDCLIYHFREDGGVHADIQFFGDKDHRFKFRITLAGLQIYDCAGVHTEAFS